VYTIELNIRNPLTGEARRLFYQIDSAAMTQAKWNGAYPVVKGKIDELVAAAQATEPPVW
jgi:hypothetical protein